MLILPPPTPAPRQAFSPGGLGRPSKAAQACARRASAGSLHGDPDPLRTPRF